MNDEKMNEEDFYFQATYLHRYRAYAEAALPSVIEKVWDEENIKNLKISPFKVSREVNEIASEMAEREFDLIKNYLQENFGFNEKEVCEFWWEIDQ